MDGSSLWIGQIGVVVYSQKRREEELQMGVGSKWTGIWSRGLGGEMTIILRGSLPGMPQFNLQHTN